MKQNIFKAYSLFRTAPISFTLFVLMAIVAAIAGNFLAAFLTLALLYAEARILILKSKVRVLGVIAGGLANIAAWGLFNE